MKKEFKYKIGQVVRNTNKIVNGHLRSEDGDYYVLECSVCGMLENFTKARVESERSLSHKCNNEICRKDKSFYDKWRLMVDRIENDHTNDYASYGARGLKCDYTDVADFYRDFYDSYVEHVAEYGKSDTTIDRIDNDLGYVKGNIRWATRAEQAINRRSTVNIVAISPDGIVYVERGAAPFARKVGLDGNAIPDYFSGRGTGQGWKFVKISKDDYSMLRNFHLNELAELYAKADWCLQQRAEQEGISADSEDLIELLANCALKRKVVEMYSRLRY